MPTRDALRCLILNAGGMYLADKVAAIAWAHDVANRPTRPHIAFIQEVPGDAWLAAWRASGYRSVLGHPRGWKVRSAVLTVLPKTDCAALDVGHIPELRYHGEYVAAAKLTGWGPAGADLALLSVHASPNPASKVYLADYPDPDRIRRRDGGEDPRYRGELFDADVVLETISRYAPDVIACGDLNEARGWDDVPAHRGQTWGAEYFGTPGADGVLRGGSVQIRDLVDVPLSAHGAEVITRCGPGHPSLQLDHIITSEEIVRQISDVAVPTWSNQEGWGRGLADHAPITFMLKKPVGAATSGQASASAGARSVDLRAGNNSRGRRRWIVPECDGPSKPGSFGSSYHRRRVAPYERWPRSTPRELLGHRENGTGCPGLILWRHG